MSLKSRYPFVVIEALDAGGSQTQTDLLAAHLEREGVKTLKLHFPHEKRATGRLIYDKFLLHKNKRPFTRREQALLYIADFFSRAEDISRVVEGKAQEKAVVSDRFYTSTLAYQTIGLSGKKRQEMLEWITWLCEQDTPALPKPDVHIFLDTPVAVSLKRLKGKKKDYFETKTKLTAIRNSYLRIARDRQWDVFDSVNADGNEISRSMLHREIWDTVKDRIVK